MKEGEQLKGRRLFDDEVVGDRVRELIVTPTSIETLPRDMARAILARLGGLQTLVMLRAIADDADVILDAPAAGALLGGVSANFMLDHWREWPFSFRIGKFVRFRKNGLLKWATDEGRR
jgi:hypothetical protein